jgi:hypothetical protein
MFVNQFYGSIPALCLQPVWDARRTGEHGGTRQQTKKKWFMVSPKA